MLKKSESCTYQKRQISQLQAVEESYRFQKALESIEQDDFISALNLLLSLENSSYRLEVLYERGYLFLKNGYYDVALNDLNKFLDEAREDNKVFYNVLSLKLFILEKLKMQINSKKYPHHFYQIMQYQESKAKEYIENNRFPKYDSIEVNRFLSCYSAQAVFEECKGVLLEAPEQYRVTNKSGFDSYYLERIRSGVCIDSNQQTYLSDVVEIATVRETKNIIDIFPTRNNLPDNIILQRKKGLEFPKSI